MLGVTLCCDCLEFRTDSEQEAPRSPSTVDPQMVPVSPARGSGVLHGDTVGFHGPLRKGKTGGREGRSKRKRAFLSH